MEGDRAAVLSVDAAVEGLIDYSKVRLRDPAWWTRWKILVTALGRKKDEKVYDATFRFGLALVANAGLTPDSFRKVQGDAQENYHDLVGTIRPWEGRSFTDRKRREMKDHRQAYIDAYGVDPASPEYKAWEAQQIARINAGEFDAPETETADQIVARRQRERAEAQRRAKGR